MVRKKTSRLTLKERIQIETLLKENKSKSYIAKTLNRSRSTITREVNKWVQTDKDKYAAELANWNAKDDYLNKRNTDKISIHKKLRVYVFKGLLSQWTPEQIAGKLKLDFPNDPIMSISHESIYRYIYTQPQARLNKKLINLLVRKKTRRRSPKKKRGTDFNLINKKQLIIIQEKLNNRPRKIIGYKTPKEIIDSELKFVA